MSLDRARRILPLAGGLLAVTLAATAATADLGRADSAGPGRAAPANLPGGEWHVQRPLEKESFRAGWLNRAAPEFALKDLQGRTVRLSDFRGKVILVNFWFSTCMPCRQETPALIQLYDIYRGRGLVVLGFNMDELLFAQEQRSYLDGFLRTFKVPYPILSVDMKTWKDFGSPPVQPTSFLIDRAGKVAEVFWGAFPGAAFERAVKPRLPPLQGPPAPPSPPAPPVSSAPSVDRPLPASEA
jgi:peroxiredoxin